MRILTAWFEWKNMKNKKSGLWQAVCAVFIVQKEKIGILGIGHAANALMVYGFDYLLYPYVVIKYGMVRGGALMALLAFVSCWLVMIFYDATKKDWLGIEMLKEARAYKGASKIRRWVANIINRSELLTIILLSIQFDAFVTTAYMRRGVGKFNGMGKRDWMIFLTSWVISNLYWTVASFFGATIVIRFWNIILEICSIALRIFILLGVSTVIFKRRLFFITASLGKHFSFFAGSEKKKFAVVLTAESFAWAIFAYLAVRMMAMA